MKRIPSALQAALGFWVVFCTGFASAEYVIFRGTTLNKFTYYGYNDTTGDTTSRKTTRTDFQIGISSSLGNAGYAVYYLNNKDKTAVQYTGDFAKGGPIHYTNINDKGKNGELHLQFNRTWREDLPSLGDTSDICHHKSGMLWGDRKLVNLRAAMFTIDTATQLKGNHTHTRWSNDFTVDSSVGAGYSVGRFFEYGYSTSTFKLDTKLTDLANAQGGSLNDAIGIVNNDLTNKGYNLTFMGALPNF